MDMCTDKVLREQAVLHRDQAEQTYGDIKEEWRYRVTNMAQSILDDRARDKLELLPCPKDMKKLSVFLLEEFKRLDESSAKAELRERKAKGKRGKSGQCKKKTQK